VVVWWSGKSICIFAKFKMAARATAVKQLHTLKHFCNLLNVSHRASSKKNLRPVLGWMMKNVPNIQKGQIICDKCRKTIADFPRSLCKLSSCLFKVRIWHKWKWKLEQF
jgi:hypothetical protein